MAGRWCLLLVLLNLSIRGAQPQSQSSRADLASMFVVGVCFCGVSVSKRTCIILKSTHRYGEFIRC